MERIKTSEEIRFERATKRVKKIKGFYKHLMVYVIVNSFIIVNNIFDLKEGDALFQFSIFSTALFWGIGLFFHAVSVFGKNIFLGDNWEERKINEYMNQNKSTKWE